MSTLLALSDHHDDFYETYDYGTIRNIDVYYNDINFKITLSSGSILGDRFIQNKILENTDILCYVYSGVLPSEEGDLRDDNIISQVNDLVKCFNIAKGMSLLPVDIPWLFLNDTDTPGYLCKYDLVTENPILLQRNQISRTLIDMIIKEEIHYSVYSQEDISSIWNDIIRLIKL
ncbi:hypothetical protein F8S13_02985 [Chloroflexia bacterium SDU3-3]|nr:hypothetical protein F8S13_02985 [Chloroflexia bacterium SDU3-3]